MSGPLLFHSNLCAFHWLPVRPRIAFKTASLVSWTCSVARYPAQLRELCVPAEDVRGRLRLRSASAGCISLPRLQTSIGKQWSLAFCRPAVWNGLPFALPDNGLLLNTFWRQLTVFSDSAKRHPTPLCRFCDTGVVYKMLHIIGLLNNIIYTSRIQHTYRLNAESKVPIQFYPTVHLQKLALVPPKRTTNSWR